MNVAYVESVLEDMPDIAVALGRCHAMNVVDDKFSEVRNRRSGREVRLEGFNGIHEPQYDLTDDPCQ
jgi:hypothetical protein